MSLDFDNKSVFEYMYSGCFGLEKESLRVDTEGFLSHTAHPFEGDVNIDRDFCENQIEIVTDVCHSTEELFDEISRLHNKVVTRLDGLESGRELLWCFSNPPYVKDEEDIPVASFHGMLKSKELYRNYLAQKYGKRKMLYSGIYYNFSFSDELIDKGFAVSGEKSLRKYKDGLYLSLAQRVLQYSWLIVYLTAASPVIDGSFLKDNMMNTDAVTPYSSARCSKIGYWNDFVPVLEYDSLESYINSIKKYVDNGRLRSASELYYPVRLKPKGDNSIENLLETGVNHIELRMLDLDPLSPVGIKKEDLYFLHLLILYLSSLEDIALDEDGQRAAVSNSKSGAEFDDENTSIAFYGSRIPLKDAAKQELDKLYSFYEKYGTAKELSLIEYQMEKLRDKNKRYAQIIKENYGTGYVIKGLELCRKYADDLKKGAVMNV